MNTSMIRTLVGVAALVAVAFMPAGAQAAYGDTEYDEAMFGYVKDVSASGSTWVRPITEHGASGATTGGEGNQDATGYTPDSCNFPSAIDGLIWCQVERTSSTTIGNGACVEIAASTSTNEWGHTDPLNVEYC